MHNKVKLGKVITTVNGYTIREIIRETTNPKGKTIYLSTGKIGLYRGKNEVQVFINNRSGMTLAKTHANTLSSEARRSNKRKIVRLARKNPTKVVHQTAVSKRTGRAAYLKRINKTK